MKVQVLHGGGGGYGFEGEKGNKKTIVTSQV